MMIFSHENNNNVLGYFYNQIEFSECKEKLSTKAITRYKIPSKYKNEIRSFSNLSACKKDTEIIVDSSLKDKLLFFESLKNIDNNVKNKIDFERSYDYKTIREYYDVNNIIIKPYPY